MVIRGHYAAERARLDLNARARLPIPAGTLDVIVGGGRGSTYHYPAGSAGVWIPLHGRLHIGDDDMTFSLRTNELLITEARGDVSATGRGNALWVAVIGSCSTWYGLMARTRGIPLPEPGLIPARQSAGRPLRQAAVQLARIAMKTGVHADLGRKEALAARLISAIAELQEEFDPLISQCPGRTRAQRQNVFLRLQRVRNYMTANCHVDMDIEHLARIANFSPCHFIRAFNAAFGTTPHAALVAFRLEHARELLRLSDLAVAEVAMASGFGNRCAFSRLFKRHYGVTAVAMRDRSRARIPEAA